MQGLDTNIINGLVKLPVETARSEASKMIECIAFKKKPERKFRLIQDIQKARTSDEVCRIMYYTHLSFEGMSVVGSKWQESFGG